MKGKMDYKEPACLRIVPFSSLQISSVVGLHMSNLHVGLFVCLPLPHGCTEAI